METAIQAIGQDIAVFHSNEPAKEDASPEDLMAANKAITQAVAKAVSAANTGDPDMVASVANLGRKVISDMLTACKVR